MAAESNDGHQVAGRAKVSQAGATLGSLFSLPESLFASASGSAQEASPAAEAGENLEAGSSTGPEASTQAQER